MKTTLILLSAGLFCLSAAAAAEPPQQEQSAAAMVSLMQTTRTRQLLDLQKSGKYASRNEQRLSGKAQQEIYQRYLKSFAHPIPETYISQSFTE